MSVYKINNLKPNTVIRAQINRSTPKYQEESKHGYASYTHTREGSELYYFAVFDSRDTDVSDFIHAAYTNVHYSSIILELPPKFLIRLAHKSQYVVDAIRNKNFLYWDKTYKLWNVEVIRDFGDGFRKHILAAKL